MMRDPRRIPHQGTCIRYAMPTTVYIGLGSNLGDRESNLRTAAALLNRAGRVTVLSSLYCTEPVGFGDQAEFLNAVAAVETDLGPLELLTLCQRIEDELGRRRAVRWGPRTVDLDILLYGDRTVRDAALVVPHPRMAERRFVLAPLAEVAPRVVHPVLGRTAEQLLAELRNDHRVIKCAP